MRVFAAGIRRGGTEPDEVDNLKKADGVDNEECDKPPFLTMACGVPECETLEDDSPENDDNDKGNKNAEKHRDERRVKRRKWLHICGLYHTLFTMRYLGVDYGSSKIGLALSDEQGTMGFPHSIVTNTPRLVDELCALIAKEDVGAVVIGESRTLSGDENPIAKDAHALGDALALRAGVPVSYESEVFTSAAARRAPEKEMKSRAPKVHANVDASAAALILTSYLSRADHD